MYSFAKEDLLQNHPRQRRVNKKRGSKGRQKRTAAMIISLAVVLILSGLWFYKASMAFAIMVNGKQVAVVEEQADGELAVQKYLAETAKNVGGTVTLQDKVEYKKIQVDKKDMVFAEDVDKVLDKTLTVLVPGAMIVVDGEEKLALSSKTAAEDLIYKIKNRYNAQIKNAKIIKAEVKEDVQVVAKNVPVKKLTDEHTAWQILTVGTEKIVTHQVADGESIWSIAQDNKIPVDKLIAANPQLNPDKIGIGDQIKLTKAEPMLHVTSVLEYSEVKTVPFETQVTMDKTLLRGKETVTQQGQNGAKEFYYRAVAVNGQTMDKQFIDAQVLTKPVAKVVKRGSKLVLASRSSGGSGDLRWPIRGGITSPFGYRHGEYHTGLDINGSTGDTVRAAESGTVIDTGWGGNYGKMIKIDHGSGVQTWYCHLSRYSVSTGDRVQRGDAIGAVGSTGRSTGSHLHFEVRVNGSPVSPIKYLD